MKHFNVLRLATLALLLASSVAQAQFVWVDEKGSKQFSDLPPPPGTPAKNILKAPGMPRAGDSVGTAPAPIAAASASSTAPASLADREADYRKRTSAKAEQDKKLAEEARIKAHNAQACAVARDTAAQLATGKRVTMTDKSGERVFVNDAQRAQQGAHAAKVLNACK